MFHLDGHAGLGLLFASHHALAADAVMRSSGEGLLSLSSVEEALWRRATAGGGRSDGAAYLQGREGALGRGEERETLAFRH